MHSPRFHFRRLLIAVALIAFGLRPAFGQAACCQQSPDEGYAACCQIEVQEQASCPHCETAQVADTEPSNRVCTCSHATPQDAVVLPPDVPRAAVDLTSIPADYPAGAEPAAPCGFLRVAPKQGTGGNAHQALLCVWQN